MKARLAGLRRAVDPRLYPVIALLLAALVVVPGQLRGSPGADAAPAAPAVAETGDGSAPAAARPTVVTLEAPGGAGGRRLGRRHNPFKAGKKAGSPAGASPEPVRTPSAGEPAARGGTGGGGSAPRPQVTATPTREPQAGVTPDPGGRAPAPPPVTTRPAWQVALRFGPAGERSTARPVARLAGLPSARRPVLLLMGLRRDHATAVFLVAAGTGVSGDGECWPAPENCKQLALRGGEAARLMTDHGSFDVQLRPVRERPVSAAAAKDARAAVAPGGRMALRTMLDRVGTLRYDAATGTVNTLDGRMRRTP